MIVKTPRIYWTLVLISLSLTLLGCSDDDSSSTPAAQSNDEVAEIIKTDLEAVGVTFSPEFSTDILSYIINIPEGLEELTFKFNISADFEITINGETIQSGQELKVDLSESRTITVDIDDGSETRRYSLRQAIAGTGFEESASSLGLEFFTDLENSGIEITPDFDENTMIYQGVIPDSVTEVPLKLTFSDDFSVIVGVDELVSGKEIFIDTTTELFFDITILEDSEGNDPKITSYRIEIPARLDIFMN